MRYRKTALSFIFIMALMSPAVCRANLEIKKKIVVYAMEVQGVQWYKKIFIFLLGYDFLDHKEITLQEIIISDPRNNQEEAVIISAKPNDAEKESLYLKNAGEKVWGFLTFINNHDFSVKEVKELMAIYNYLYTANEGATEFFGSNVFEKQKDPDQLKQGVFYKIVKIRKGAKIVIQIISFDGQKRPSATLDLILNPAAKTFDSIIISLTSGPKIILTKKSVS